MKISLRSIYTFWMLVLSMEMMGCASAPATRFYMLSPMPLSENRQSPPDSPCVSIGIGPVKIPEYLGRSGIVTQVTPHELMIGDLNKWAESLEESLPRVMAENLSSLLCTGNVFILPAKRVSPIDYTIRVEVIRLDGKLGDEAVLDVFWTILAGKETLVSKRSSYRQKIIGEGYEDFVSAQSRNVASFSSEVAKAILAHPK